MNLVSEGECPSHVLVIYRHRFFKLSLYHENKLLNASEFYNQLESIFNRYITQPYGIGIGALTADYRDSWATVR